MWGQSITEQSLISKMLGTICVRNNAQKFSINLMRYLKEKLNKLEFLALRTISQNTLKEQNSCVLILLRKIRLVRRQIDIIHSFRRR